MSVRSFCRNAAHSCCLLFSILLFCKRTHTTDKKIKALSLSVPILHNPIKDHLSYVTSRCTFPIRVQLLWSCCSIQLPVIWLVVMFLHCCLALLALFSLSGASDPGCEELIKPLEDRSKVQCPQQRHSPWSWTEFKLFWLPEGWIVITDAPSSSKKTNKKNPDLTLDG